MDPVVVLLILALVGCAILTHAREGSNLAYVGGVLALACLMAIPVGLAMGTF